MAGVPPQARADWRPPSILGHAPTGPGAAMLEPQTPQQKTVIRAKRRTGIEQPQTLKSALVRALTVGSGHE